jgi:hypothetical protein
VTPVAGPACRPSSPARQWGRVRHRPHRQAADPWSLLLRAVHGDARQHHRERGPAEHPARPGRRRVRAAAGGRQPAADRRLARRPVRPPAGVPRRAGGVHRQLGAVRPGAQPGGAGRRARPAGGRRRRAAADHPGDRGRDLPRPAGARAGDRAVVGRVGDGAGGRPGAWRAAHRCARLALGVLRQRAGRRGGVPGGRAGDRRVAEPRRPPPGRAGVSARRGWARSPSR